MMPTRNKAEWRAQYRETTELLETLRARELKNMTDERAGKSLSPSVLLRNPGANARTGRDW